MFAAFALSPRSGGSRHSQPSAPALAHAAADPPQIVPPLAAQLVPAGQLPPPSPPLQADPERDAWAAGIYQRLTSSALLVATLDSRQPTVPVILHPSAPRGSMAPPVTPRHLGFLRVDLTGETAGPGRFFPLFPADAAEAEAGVDTGSLDRFGCSGHWASSGCIRLLAASSWAGSSGSSSGSSSSGGSCSSGVGAAGTGQLALIPLAAFAALWVRSSSGRSSSGRGEATPSPAAAFPAPAAAPSASNTGGRGAEESCGDWHVPYSRLLPLEEAYGGLARELKAAGADLSKAHYMLRGWKTREGRPRQGSSAARAAGGGQRPRRGVVPAELAATRDLRAMMSWPGLLELLEEEGVACVSTDGVRYWLARLGGGFQARLAAAGVLCSESTVHHIIARSNRGIDHPLNYFLVDRGPNSAMGSKVEGFRDASGAKLHMRDVVGERAFEVAQAACNLYHGVLYAGQRRGVPLSQSLRELREGAFALADEAIEARRAREARQQARRAATAAASTPPSAGVQQGAAAAAADPGQGCPQQQQQQQHQVGSGSQPRSLKRERCSSQQGQGQGQRLQGGSENAAHNHDRNHAPLLLSPTQQQQERRRRLSGELRMVAPVCAPAGAAAAGAGDEEALAGEAGTKAEVEAGLAALSLSLSLCCSPVGILRSGEGAQQQQQQQGQGEVELKPEPPVDQVHGQHQRKPTADLSSLRARLQAALGSAATSS